MLCLLTEFQVNVIDRKAYMFEGDSGETVKEIPIPAELTAKMEETRHTLVERLAEVDEEV